MLLVPANEWRTRGADSAARAAGSGCLPRRFLACDSPEAAVADTSIRRFQRKKQISAGTSRTRLCDVFQDGIANLTLQWIFLHASALGVIHCERLLPPVEVTQQQARYLSTAQPIYRQEQQDRPGAKGDNALPLDAF